MGLGACRKSVRILRKQRRVGHLGLDGGRAPVCAASILSGQRFKREFLLVGKLAGCPRVKPACGLDVPLSLAASEACFAFFSRRRLAALRQHVGVATGIGDPASIRIGRIWRAPAQILTVRSRKSRSWLIRITFPDRMRPLPAAGPVSPCRDRWSAHRGSAGSKAATEIRASTSRAFSPPDRFRIGVRACSGWNRKSFM
jgi:hypothetical protein